MKTKIYPNLIHHHLSFPFVRVKCTWVRVKLKHINKQIPTRCSISMAQMKVSLMQLWKQACKHLLKKRTRRLIKSSPRFLHPQNRSRRSMNTRTGPLMTLLKCGFSSDKTLKWRKGKSARKHHIRLWDSTRKCSAKTETPFPLQCGHQWTSLRKH